MTTSEFPKWLTVDFLKSCLESDDENFRGITITSHTFKSALPPGSNYGSNIVRANIRHKKSSDTSSSTEHSISLILKVPLAEDSLVAVALGDGFKSYYESEIKFYYEFISETYKLSKHDIVAKHYKAPNSLCLVMEDLNTLGFKMADRCKLLDFDHCKLYAEASAKIHALSMAIYQSNPELIQSFGCENKTTDKYNKLALPNYILCMATYLEDKPNYKKQYEITKEASKNEVFWTIYTEMMNICKSKPFKALTVEDPWCPNMMFKYNTFGKPVAIKILDYQIVRFRHSLFEFVLFLSVSTNLEVRQTRLDDLYQIYCDSLNGNLAELGCPERLSLESLKTDITYLTPLMFLWMCGLPATIADPAPDYSEFSRVRFSAETVKETSFYKTVFTDKNFHLLYPHIIDVYEKFGVFDYMLKKIKDVKSRR